MQSTFCFYLQPHLLLSVALFLGLVALAPKAEASLSMNGVTVNGIRLNGVALKPACPADCTNSMPKSALQLEGGQLVLHLNR